jgi:hypothetical protein
MVTRRRESRSALGRAARPRGEPPTWTTWGQAVGVVLYRPHLRRTLAIALVVGTVLFCINQLDVVVRGDATAVVWIKAAVTYVVPFAVSNAGVLVASRIDGSGSGRARPPGGEVVMTEPARPARPPRWRGRR